MNDSVKSVGIVGIGMYVPEKIVTNFDLEKILDTSDEWIYSRTGIKQRHVVDDQTATSDIATEAAKQAIDHAGISVDEIDLIIVATATPDMTYPSVACLVQKNIAAFHAAAFDLTAGCSGFVYAMTVAKQFIAAGMYKTVLIVGAETLSKTMNWEDRNTCVLFGDGAGAAVLQEVPEGYGVIGTYLGADGRGSDYISLPAGGSRLGTTLETIENKLHYTHMNGNEVFKFAVKIMGEAALKALDNAHVNAGDVNFFIPHQANIRIIQSAAKRLKIPMEKVVINVDQYGNTSAASIPIALTETLRAGKIKDGDIIAVVGFGAGLTWASAVIKWYDPSNKQS